MIMETIVGEHIVQYAVYQDFTSIFDCYKIWCLPTMIKAVRNIKEKYNSKAYEDYAINKRSTFAFIIEWYIHNILYCLGICRIKTKNLEVDKDILKDFKTIIKILFNK